MTAVTWTQFLGGMLLAAPFVVVTAVGVKFVGWIPMAVIYGLTVAMALAIVAGVYLLTGSL